jgi:hypothetical protein
LISIYQIFYQDSQRVELDPAFTPYDNKGKVYPYNFEYAVFFDLANKIDWAQTGYAGTTSWKFRQKTGLSGSSVLEHIAAHPGADIYFVNPAPELCIYRSVWEHGSEYHPNIIELTSRLFRKCGYPTEILHKETPPNLTAYCNYWVANKKFWDAYIEFLQPLWDYILTADDDLMAALKQNADPYIKAPYLPFIFERLFSTFLSQNSFIVDSIPIAQQKLQANPFLAPIEERIWKVSRMKSHLDIPLIDRFLIRLWSTARKLRYYYAPQLKRKLLTKRPT